MKNDPALTMTAYLSNSSLSRTFKSDISVSLLTLSLFNLLFLHPTSLSSFPSLYLIISFFLFICPSFSFKQHSIFVPFSLYLSLPLLYRQTLLLDLFLSYVSYRQNGRKEYFTIYLRSF